MIEVKDVTKRIRGTNVLQNINLTIPSNAVVGIRGSNGSGKTMLLRLIAGLIYPTTGEVVIDKVPLQRGESPRSIGALIERPAFLQGRTGLDNLRLLASINKIADDEDIYRWIRRVGLNPTDRRKVRRYSLGMKQRLGIAAAFFEIPRIILLDEPTNALDSTGIEMLKSIIRHQRNHVDSIVITCHDDRFLRSEADLIIEMAAGRITSKEAIEHDAA